LERSTITLSHLASRKSPLERGAYAAPIQIGNAFNGLDRFLFVFDNEPRYAIFYDFGHRSASPRNNRGAARHRFDHHQPKWFRPIDREEHRDRVAEKVLLLALIDLADKLDAASTSASTAPQSQVDVEAVLNKLASQNREKLDWRKSIVDLMKLLKLDSSLSARQGLAKELHYSGDTKDSTAMNIWLHKQVMIKLAENGGKVPDDLRK
jgi:hypothetical protein